MISIELLLLTNGTSHVVEKYAYEKIPMEELIGKMWIWSQGNVKYKISSFLGEFPYFSLYAYYNGREHGHRDFHKAFLKEFGKKKVKKGIFIRRIIVVNMCMGEMYIHPYGHMYWNSCDACKEGEVTHMVWMIQKILEMEVNYMSNESLLGNFLWRVSF